jgi:pimeloyl-ACP methyl ester carboxylesterase
MGERDLGDSSAASRAAAAGQQIHLDQRLTFYQSYFRADRFFVPSVDDATTVDARDIGFYIHEGLKALERIDITSLFRFNTLIASDGVKLNTYSIGDRAEHAILICNAVGMPADLVSHLAIRLAELAPVLTWESRGLPSKDTDFTDMDVSLARQAQDGVEVLGAGGVKTAVIVGWCAGARLAIELAATWAGHVRGLVLLNGGYNLTAGAKTPFEMSMNTSMPKISRDRRLAEVFYHGIFAGAQASDAATASPDGLLRSASASDVYLASLPFHSADNLYRYSRLTTPYIERPFALCDSVKRMRALVMTGDADKTASPESSRSVAELIPDADFVSIDGADHYSLYWDDQFMSRATQFAKERIAAR